jgi:hypothetical protein
MSRLGRESDPVSNTMLQPSSRAQLKLGSAKSRSRGLRLNIEPLGGLQEAELKRTWRC